MRLERGFYKLKKIIDALHCADHMILNVAKIGMNTFIDHGCIEPHEAVAYFLQWLDRPTQLEQIVTYCVNTRDIRLTCRFRKDRALNSIHFALEFMDDWEKVIYDGVHDRINNEALSHGKHLRRALASGTYLAIPGGRAVSDG